MDDLTGKTIVFVASHSMITFSFLNIDTVIIIFLICLSYNNIRYSFYKILFFRFLSCSA